MFLNQIMLYVPKIVLVFFFLKIKFEKYEYFESKYFLFKK